jgi:hydrogenase maturation protease
MGKCDILVLGLGNTLLADDGVGVYVVRHLASDPDTPACVRTLDGGTPGFRLMGALTRSDSVILVDAAQLRAPAGTLRLLDGHTLAGHISRGGRMSAHDAGLEDLLTMARLMGWIPTHLALLGIQPERVGWSEQLSESVARAFPAACRMVVQTVLDWQSDRQ